MSENFILKLLTQFGYRVQNGEQLTPFGVASMSNRTLTFLVVIFFAAMGLLFLVNFSGIFSHKTDEKYISLNDVRGMAVYHSNKPYTLNFEQQTESLGFINRAFVIDKTEVSSDAPPMEISKIVIYRFGKQSDIVITPIMYKNDELIFSAPVLEKDRYLKENRRGKLKKLLSQTYDL